jgi:hypothetical protein
VLLEYYLSAGVSVEEVAELLGHVGAGYDVNVRAQRVVGQAVLSGHIPNVKLQFLKMQLFDQN